MKNRKLHLILTLPIFAAGTLWAGETEGAKPDRGEKRAAQFARTDKNGDGAVTKEEFLATKASQKDPEKAAKAFARFDKDGNGSLSKEEFAGAQAKKPAKAPAADDGDAN
jgi:Ca2+-binding EF-hand superfamily protein